MFSCSSAGCAFSSNTKRGIAIHKGTCKYRLSSIAKEIKKRRVDIEELQDTGDRARKRARLDKQGQAAHIEVPDLPSPPHSPPRSRSGRHIRVPKRLKDFVPAAQDDKKLQGALKKLNVQPIPGVEEVNMFREDGNVLHFSTPKVHAAVTANTFAIYGAGHVKELTELVPGILNQLGPDSLASLRKLAESYQAIQQSQQRPPAASNDDDDDDVPDLVENFEQVAVEDKEKPAEEEKKDNLEELN
ncbi:hypothetical protein NUW54_g4292 [Trametes sanguinea]|uniref:Uncharacterized protein n=1 Tax=Trametes sanguinea TaxID=158606 RepID=A0ACC1Q0G2_9APHY|nr:hypothetical protein NUW54_g4292 [Trametes sanguinea]